MRPRISIRGFVRPCVHYHLTQNRRNQPKTALWAWIYIEAMHLFVCLGFLDVFSYLYIRACMSVYLSVYSFIHSYPLAIQINRGAKTRRSYTDLKAEKYGGHVLIHNGHVYITAQVPNSLVLCGYIYTLIIPSIPPIILHQSCLSEGF